MKNMKKLLALVLAVMMVMAMAVSAQAASITINRDSSYDSEASGNTVYTYTKILNATITGTLPAVNESTGEWSGTAGTVVYWVEDDNQANALKTAGVFTVSEKTADNKYYVTSTATSGETIASAIQTMLATYPDAFTSIDKTSDGATTTISGLDAGYYYISASNGSKLAVQTLGEVTINEKNTYPGIDKQQKKANGTYTDDPVTTEVGTYIDYQVVVTVPGNANKSIQVVDTMSDGLEYDSVQGLTVTPAAATYTELTDTDTAYSADAAWQIKFSDDVVTTLQGKTITITYRAKVTDAALIDADKENEVKLDYDQGHYVVTDHVDYEVYFAGIYKIDPNDSTADMSGVKFLLNDGDGNPVKVTYDTNGYYVVDPDNTSNEVETRADGTNYTIKIRGLDGEKTYTLTETETVAGYNLLAGTVTLTKTKDEGTVFADKAANTYDKVENNKGTELPSTGGIGTTIFYAAGLVMVLGAAVVLISRRKAEAED